MEFIVQMLYDCTIISKAQAIKYYPNVMLYGTHNKETYVSDSELETILSKTGAARDAAIRSLLNHFYHDNYGVAY